MFPRTSKSLVNISKELLNKLKLKHTVIPSKLYGKKKPIKKTNNKQRIKSSWIH